MSLGLERLLLQRTRPVLSSVRILFLLTAKNVKGKALKPAKSVLKFPSNFNA